MSPARVAAALVVLAACKREEARPPAPSVDPEGTEVRRDGGDARGAVLDAAAAPDPARPALPADERAALRGTIHAAAGHEGEFRVVAIAPATGATTTITPDGDASWHPVPGAAPLAIRVTEEADLHDEQLVLLDGAGGARPLGPTSRMVRAPAATRDGRTVIVEIDHQGVRNLHRVDVATGKVAPLTEGRQGNFEPSLSPDGARVAFASSRDGDLELYAMPVRGGDATRLTTFHRDDWAPAWSPDGAWIAFLSDREGTPRVFLVRPDGTELRPLHAGPPGGEEQDHAWSPDGTRVAYVVSTADGASEVWVADVAAGQARRISAAGARDEVPSWSPDGAHLVYLSTRDRRIDLWIARADGTAESRLTDTPEEEWIPRWRP